MAGDEDTGASPEEPVETRRRDKRPLDLLDPELKFEDVRPVSVEDLEQARRELDAATRELFRKISYPEPVAELIADRCVVRRGRLGTVGRAVSCPSGGCFVAGLCASSARFCALDGVPV